jgi:hypothetical protein
MSAEEAEEYHARQIGVFAESDAGLTTAITMAYAEEVGVACRRRRRDPVGDLTTVEIDGRSSSGPSARRSRRSTKPPAGPRRTS